MMDRDQIEAELADVNAQLDALIAERDQYPQVFDNTKMDRLYDLEIRKAELERILNGDDVGLNSSADQDQLDINILSSLIPPMPKF